MCRIRAATAMLFVPLVVCGTICGRAQQPAAPPLTHKADRTDKPAGLRVVRLGNSWFTEESQHLCKLAGIVGHTTVKREGLNAGTLEGVQPGEVDVWIWGRTTCYPDKDFPPIIEKGIGQNPKFRLLVQQPWLVHDGLKRDANSKPEDYELTDLAEYQVKLEKNRADLEAAVDKLNAHAGRRVVFIVPLADGLLELRKLIKAGKMPGVTQVNRTVLAGDIMPHQGPFGGYLGNFMHFAILYRTSPEGLPWPDQDVGLTEAQRAILQKLAWEMVSKYPYAGIAKPPEPLPATSNPAGGG